jgi:PAS domain S-box-containing protein
MNGKAVILAVGEASESPALVKILIQAGYGTRTAESGESAVSAATVNPPDLILLNIRMKGMDGIETCRRLKSEEGTRRIPVILISDAGGAGEWVEGLRLGAADYISKPFQNEELLNRVSTHLALRRAHLLLERRAAEPNRTGGDMCVETKGSAILSKGEFDVVQAVTGDITERKLAERALRLKNLVFHASLAATCIIDLEGIITETNGAFQKAYGCPGREGLAGRPVTSFISDPGEAGVIVAAINETGRWEGDYTANRIDGSTFIAHGLVTVMQDENGKAVGYQSTVIDITARKALEAELFRHREDLRALAKRLVAVQETERKAISRELHDEIGQALTAVKFNLIEIGKDIAPECGRRIADRIEESDVLIERLLEQIHEISLDLHPALLDDLGLVSTLRWYVRRFAKRVGVEVVIDAKDPAERMDPDLETNLYRIAQEALTNITKHARAKKAVIRLSFEHSAVLLSISDDGIGFDLEEAQGGRTGVPGMGLIGMSERVASLQGRLDIKSSSGHGTRLLISVPWKGRENV